MARRNSHRVMGGVFVVMGLLVALIALSEAVRGFDDGVSAMFLFPTVLAVFFFAVGAYLLRTSPRRGQGR